MNLACLLDNTSERLPSHTAVRFEGARYNFRELNRLVNRRANGLVGLGLKQGDRCILMMPSCAEFIITYYALAKIGVTIIPVHYLYRAFELTHIFTDCGANAFVGMAPYLKEADKALGGLSDLTVRMAHGAGAGREFIPLEMADGPDRFNTYDARDEDVLAILYTSGTTGRPKGVMLTHRNLYTNAMIEAEIRPTGSNDVVIGILPIFHIYGQSAVMNYSICLGLTLHLMKQFYPPQILRLIETESATILPAIPTMFNRLLHETDRKPIKRSSLRFCCSGGSSLPVDLLHRFEERFQTTIYDGYGLTESSPTCIENYGEKTKPGSIGKPIPGFKARLVDDSGQDVTTGTIGELIVSGPGVMKGYLNQPEETARTIVNGWLYTGDMARQDAEGFFYIVGRRKEMIICGGYNVYPREIEEVVYRHPGVKEAAVYGVPARDLGEEVALDIVLKNNTRVTRKEIHDYIKGYLATYKHPRMIRFVDDLPKGFTGKVRKRLLTDRWLRENR